MAEAAPQEPRAHRSQMWLLSGSRDLEAQRVGELISRHVWRDSPASTVCWQVPMEADAAWASGSYSCSGHYPEFSGIFKSCGGRVWGFDVRGFLELQPWGGCSTGEGGFSGHILTSPVVPALMVLVGS